MKRAKFIVNKSHLKVPADELLFDLIYIIIISKVSQIIFGGEHLSLQVVSSGLIVFTILVAIWFMRVNHLNRIHLLQLKLENNQFKSEWLTYAEIVLLVTVLFTIQTFTVQNIILVFVVAALTSILSVSRVRHKILADVETHLKFHEYYQPGEKTKRDYEVNVGYVYERFIIIFVLFMGEILSNLFSTSTSAANLFLALVLMVSIFNANVKILNASQNYLEQKSNARIYRGTVNYAKSLLTLLLGVLISIEAAHEIVFATSITLVVLIIYLIFEQQMKRAMKLRNNRLIMVSNLITIIILLLPLPLPDVFKFIWGTFVFILNMFFAK